MKNLLNLSFKFQFRKKTTIINVILITLAILVVLGVNTYCDSAINYIENDVYDSVYFKSIAVGIRDDDDREKARKELENIDHVLLVSNYYSYSDILMSKKLSNKKLSGEVVIYISNNNTLPKIKYGTNFPDESSHYLVCPVSLYSTSDFGLLKTISSRYAINMREYLNQTLYFPYKTFSQEDIFNITFKVIGLYEPRVPIESNICYTQEHSLETIIKNRYSDEIDEESGVSYLDYQTSFFVQADEYKNLEEIKNKISDLGYGYENNAMVIPSYFDNIKKITKKTSIIVIVITFILILIVSLKLYNEDLKTFKLLKCLGYKKKSLFKILVLSNIVQLFISLLLSFLTFLLFYIVFRVFLIFYPFIMNNWEVVINYKSIIWIIVITMISTIIGMIISIFRFNGDY